MKNKILISVCVIFGVILASLFVYNSLSSAGGSDNFAKCLSENEAIFYGTEWCGYCQNQKKILGSSFQHINYVDCDTSRTECTIAGIRGYPTWKIKGQNYPGMKQLSELSDISGCPI